MNLKFTISVLSILVLGIVAHPVLTTFYDFSKEAKSTKTVLIPKYTPVSGFARMLYEGGVIKSAPKFKILVSLMGKSQLLRPGEYEFTVPDHPINILKKITSGKVKTYKVTIPEGLTMRESGVELQNAGLADKNKFALLLHDSELMKEFSIKGPSLEGYLFPETYILDKTMSEKDLAEIMLKRFFKEVTPSLIDEGKKAGMELNEIVTLASMIEKETGVDLERPLISSVFHNRLAKGMRLQCDPTVIYGIVDDEINNPTLYNAAISSFRKIKEIITDNSSPESRYRDYRGNLTKEHLSTYSPYNTYVIKGLPIGPISNPGLASIEAAIYPAQTKFIFFVSKNDGSHTFSETYTQHLNGVKLYQKGGSKPATAAKPKPASKSQLTMKKKR